MKLVGRIPVEPLDDERLTNIERRIVAGAADAAARTPVRESRMHLALAFAIVVVVVLGAGVFGYKLRGGDAPVVAVEPTTVKVHTDATRSTLDIGDARITSDPATVFALTRPDGGVLVTMTRGKVELQVDKRGERPPLVVRAGDTDVVVIGTRFSVDFGDGSGPVDVRVTEGIVKVVRHGEDVRVAAGHEWHTDRGLVAFADTTVPTAKQPDTREIDMGAQETHDPAHEHVVKVPDRAGSGSGSNTAQRPTRDKQSTITTAPNLKKQIEDANVAEPLHSDLRDPLARIEEYRQIVVTKTGPVASNAFYSIAYVQYSLKGKGHEDDALRTLDQYLNRFIGGAEYMPALWLRVRILCLRSFDDACHREAARYLRHATTQTNHTAIAERITDQ